MDGRVRRVDELPEDDGAGSGIAKLLRPADGAFHALGAWGQHKLGPKGLEQAATLLAHGLWHGKHYVIPLRGPHPCQSDSGIAAGRLYDGCAGLQRTARLRVLNHGQGHTVFDASARVEVFELQDDFGLLAIKAGHPQKRSIADQLSQRIMDHNRKS